MIEKENKRVINLEENQRRSHELLERIHRKYSSIKVENFAYKKDESVLGEITEFPDTQLFEFGTPQIPTLTVTAAVRALNNTLDGLMSHFWIEGEVAEVYRSRYGHVYFKLKDEESLINAVLFSRNEVKYPATFKQGDKIEVQGNFTLYPKTGALQISVIRWREKGLGEIYEAFLRLKKSLANEGLFSDEFKKSLVSFPTRVALITSENSAAWSDVMRTIQRRTPWIEVETFDTIVQGVGAVKSLITNLKLADTRQFDAILLVRGGGAYEDLVAFNDESLARVIFSLNTPLICGVGHESDETICDFVADLRASTPTAAAESLCQSKEYWLRRISSSLVALTKSFFRTWEEKADNLSRIDSLFFVRDSYLSEYSNSYKKAHSHFLSVFIKEHSIKTEKANTLIGFMRAKRVSTESFQKSLIQEKQRLITGIARSIEDKKEATKKAKIVYNLSFFAKVSQLCARYESQKEKLPKKEELFANQMQRAKTLIGLIASKSISTYNLQTDFEFAESRFRIASINYFDTKSRILIRSESQLPHLIARKLKDLVADYERCLRLRPKSQEVTRMKEKELNYNQKALFLANPDRPLTLGFARLVDSRGNWIKSAAEVEKGLGYTLKMNEGNVQIQANQITLETNITTKD